MAMPQSQRTMMASFCAPDTVHVTYLYKIDSYGIYRGFGIDNFINSTTFVIGDHDWCIRFYPDDYNEESEDFMSAFLELKTMNTAVRAMYSLMLVNQGIQPPVLPFKSAILSDVPPVVFDSYDDKLAAWGTSLFKKSDLEGSTYILDDSIIIACRLTVIKLRDAKEVDTGLIGDIQVPPFELVDNLSKLLGATEGVDVSFKVQAEVFRAHKIILAMRSPIFKAEFYEPMRDDRSIKTIEDMQPGVFKGLLHFIYTDLLPPMEDLDAAECEEMLRHLLVAADRYAMERMKSMCERNLCQRLDHETVAATLALADHHHCSKLKDACIEFINSLSTMDGLLGSKGYQHLKRECPTIFVDVWEKATKTRKI